MPTTSPIVIDCDPGHDDALAILLAGRTLDVRAITAVHGNAPLSRTQVNARKVLELGELTHIPVAAGCAAPLVRQASYAPEVHGASGLDGPDLPEPTMQLVDADASDVIIDLSRQVPNLHVVAVGPLTNVAVALRRDPSLASRLERISLMGGSLTWGNVTPAAEFNIWCDPEAAHIVFSSGVPITMVGLNVTMQCIATPERRAQLRATGRRAATAAAEMLDHYAVGEGQYSGLPGGALHDPLVIAGLLDPTLLETVPMHVAVELSGKLTAGMTLCDGRGLGPDLRQRGTRRSDATPPNADVAVGVDDARFWDLLFEHLAAYA
jgi:inosine-uridine nucleoside N-ribohydrolase